MKPVKVLVLTGTALLVLAAGAWLWWRGSTTADTTFMAANAARGDIEETVLATGTLKPVRLVAVGAQVSGRITSIKVALGQSVKSGDPVAEIDSATQENNLRTADAALADVRAQLVEKQATLVLNQQSLTRQQEMVTKNAVSRADYESAVAALAVTEAQISALDAQIKQATVAVETAQVNVGYTRITAPIDGTVLSIVSQEGQTVNATQSTPTIVILGQLETMTVRTEISEVDVTRVRPGLPVYFTVLGDPSHRYDAVLEFIEPAPESIRSDSSFSSSSSSSSTSSSSSEAIYYNGVFNVPNAEGKLRTYMTAEVHIVLGTAKDVLVIPAAALGAKDPDGRQTVRILGKDGKTEERKVEIGLNDKVNAEVRSGLAEGDRVVTGEIADSDTATSGQGGGGPPPMGL